MGLLDATRAQIVGVIKAYLACFCYFAQKPMIPPLTMQLGIYEQLINKLVAAQLQQLDQRQFYVKQHDMNASLSR
ncbi:hypothetical protein GCM10023091_16300 [Ravibacter arvi]|uniref:Uncharacterized protein n=1 Tax=Ravibacter arvi TaxID=2051041 RepID=A0ABP8LXJ4_9BACT